MAMAYRQKRGRFMSVVPDVAERLAKKPWFRACLLNVVERFDSPGSGDTICRDQLEKEISAPPARSLRWSFQRFVFCGRCRCQHRLSPSTPVRTTSIPGGSGTESVTTQPSRHP